MVEGIDVERGGDVSERELCGGWLMAVNVFVGVRRMPHIEVLDKVSHQERFELSIQSLLVVLKK